MNLNKVWLYLLIIAVATLVLTGGWEVYQIATGNRDNFNYVVTPMPNNRLLSPELEEHLRSAITTTDSSEE